MLKGYVRKKKMVKQHAFSLVELMVVVAIIGVLAVAAIPSYQSYMIRSRIGSVAGTIEPLQAQILQAHSSGTVYGLTTTVVIANNDPNLPNYMSQLSIANYGCIRVDYNLAQLGISNPGTQVLALEYCPQSNANAPDLVTWSCGYSSDSTVALKIYLPNNCQQLVTTDTTF